MPLPKLHFSSRSFSTSLVDPAFLLRLSTVLYQQQTSPLPKLQTHLQKLNFSPTHELFLQLCNNFPFSWRPVHNFLLHSKLTHNFTHSLITANKALDVFGKSRNIDLLHSFLLEMSQTGLITKRSLEIAATHLAGAREIKKCVEIFELDDGFKNVEVLNRVVRTLCARRYVDVAKSVVMKIKDLIPPDEATYGFLIVGFCRAGDLVEAAKIWNRVLDSGLEPDVSAYEEIVETLFKNNRFEDAMIMFKRLQQRKFCNLGSASYCIVIDWVCKEGKITYAFMVLAEMLKRGIEVDKSALGDLIYGLLVRKRVREGYRIFQGVEEPDINMHHGLMKGLLRLRRAREATQVLREMVKRGCEPNMHTYIMLLQGHLGKRGRKGRDPMVNFESIFVGGLVKAGRTLEATKYVERMMKVKGVEVPRFDYNKFMYWFSNEEGLVMFEEVGMRLKEVGLVDVGDVLLVYGQRMATRDRRRKARVAACMETVE
ncbi:putative pentatricopeptide repeat-containing protein At1g26500 [Asparagus officinalis]|uniref:putative pentatricopeptide repeat-containing protein At1g26500 n=1 Tax=Asparagus officinalis TaxID=4686 RepID=UPI00098DF210|nr:putative pentatricopeptide repeat-containing protein At1g26500 [Asparagus officinalis]